MSEDFGDVYFGTEKANDIDWRSGYDPEEVDDEELAETPEDVVGMLGFDPKELGIPKKMGLAAVIKHLFGTEYDHDQQSHAGNGLGDTVSVIDAVAKPGYASVELALELENATEVWKGSVGIDSVGNKISSQTRLYDRLKDNEDFKELSRELQKTLTEGYLSDPYRSDEGIIKLLVDTWAGTSCDSDPLAISVQMAVEKEFGIKETYIPGSNSSIYNPAFETAVKAFPKREKGLRAFVRAQYEETQQYLKDKGIKRMLLFRGVGESGLKGLSEEQLKKGVNDVDIKMMPISSFSVSSEVAGGFIVSARGAILVGVVPAERIFSTPKTGIGCTKEGEVVVLGGKMKVTSLNDLPDGKFAVSLGYGAWPLLRDIQRIGKEEKK